MDGGIIDHHHGFLGDGIAKGIETADHQLGIHIPFHAERYQVVVDIEETQDIETLAFCRGDFYSPSHRLPGVRDRGIKRKTGFVKINQINQADLLFFLTPEGFFRPLERLVRLVWI